MQRDTFPLKASILVNETLHADQDRSRQVSCQTITGSLSWYKVDLKGFKEESYKTLLGISTILKPLHLGQNTKDRLADERKHIFWGPSPFSL